MAVFYLEGNAIVGVCSKVENGDVVSSAVGEGNAGPIPRAKRVAERQQVPSCNSGANGGKGDLEQPGPGVPMEKCCAAARIQASHASTVTPAA